MGWTVITSLTMMICNKVVQARGEAAQQSAPSLERGSVHSDVQDMSGSRDKGSSLDRVEEGNGGLVFANTVIDMLSPMAHHAYVGDEHGDDATATTKPNEPPLPTPYLGDERDEILAKVERQTGVEARMLYAICMVESHCDSTRVGDNGQSYGAYQVFQRAHPNTIEIAKDFERATQWTAEYLLKNGYATDKWRAAQCHNGCGAENGYVEKVKRYYQ